MIEDINKPDFEPAAPVPAVPPADGEATGAAPGLEIPPTESGIRPDLHPDAFAPAPLLIQPPSNGQPAPSAIQILDAPAPAQTPLTSPPTRDKPGPPEIKDNFREIVETVVFVIVLVLLLKGFLAEAFVIPTGSMATTLLGYHQMETCPECGYRFPVNMPHLDPDGSRKDQPVTGCTCRNCLKPFSLSGVPSPVRNQ